jgi:WD40 repeat protein
MFRKGDEPIRGYRLEKFLGKGQFGEVWRTTAPGGTSAALKFIDLGGKQGIKEFRGVQRVKEIRHANLMPITALWMLDGEGNVLGDKLLDTFDLEQKSVQATLDAGQVQEVRPEWLVVAMLLGRKNLADRLEECRAAGQNGIPVDELLRYMEEAAKGIDYLNHAQHDLGEGSVAIQHCDVKPANIMLIGDAAAVCDFGLARVLSDATATATGMVGSPAYMAPECIGRKPGPASDQYSLAVSYVELRTGQLPFKEITYIAVLEANRSGVLELSRLTPGEQQVIRKATSLKPEDRYPSTLAMVKALQRAVEGKVAPASMPGWLWAAVAVVTLIGLPAIAWVAVTKLRTVPVVDDSREVTISIKPTDAQVKIGGQTTKMDANGKLIVKLRPGVPVALEATHPGDYAPLRRTLALEQMSSGQLALELEPNAQWYAKKAIERIAAGDRTAAVDFYKEAVRTDPTLESPTALELKQHTKMVRIIKMSPRGDWFATTGDDGLVYIWSIQQKTGPQQPPAELLSQSAEKLTESMDVSADGRWLVAGGRDNQVRAWELHDRQSKSTPIELGAHEEDVTVVKVVPQSSWIASGSLDNSIRLWRLVDNRPTNEFVALPGHGSEVVAMCVTTDGDWLISLDSDNHLRRWAPKSNQPEMSSHNLADMESKIKALAATPNGLWLVVGREDSKVAIMGIKEGDRWREFPGATDAIESLVFSQSGERLYAGDASGAIVRWDVTAGGELTNAQAIHQHGGVVPSLAVSADGSFAVSGSWDATAAYWRTGTEGKIAPLRLVTKHGPVRSIAITPDGKWIIAGCEDGTILVWDATLCDVIQEAVEKRGPRPKSSVKA